MEEDHILEGENRRAREDSFIERQRPKEYANSYLICNFRFSIIEKIITQYLFQLSGKGKDYSLNQLSKDLSKNPDDKSLFLAYLRMFLESFGPESPLFFYSQLSKEIIKLFQIKDLSKIEIDDYILKIEFLLAWHFESNFYPRTEIFEIIPSLNDNIYLTNGITNYIYSIESISTIEHFMKVFEKQSLFTKIEEDFKLVNNLFCSEKVYYFYCDKMNKDKKLCGNFVKYLLQQLNTKIMKNKNTKFNGLDIENYIMINLYLIDKIIQNYTFYLYKEPELIEIFDSLEVLKTWSSPISNYCNRVLENIINENYFQGISLFNKFRQDYYLDLIDDGVTSIDTKLFKYTLIIYSKEWERRHEKDKNNVFDILKFIKYLKDKPKKKRNNILIIKEILIRLLITIIMNSDQKYNDDTFKKLYSLYLPNYKNIYDDKNIYNNDDKVKASLDKLFKIIDVGLDKPVNDFNNDINVCAKKIMSVINSAKTDKNKGGDNIFENEFFLPINYMRNYLKPNYTEIKSIYKEDKDNKNEKSMVNIFDSYINNFKDVVNNYFKYFFTSPKDEITKKNLEKMRKNFFNNYRINVLLFEEENTINELIENLQNKIFNVLNEKISDEDFNKFWKFFVSEKKEIIPKFLLHVVPSYERSSSNPFRLLTEENSLKNYQNYLSEYIANHDYIYKNVIFMPFASSCDGPLNTIINKAPEKTNDFMRQPPINTLFSPLKKALNYYLGDSHGIFNLDLYQVTINDNAIKKVFFKNIEILEITNDSYKQTKMTLTCVDSLGIEYEKETEINLFNNNFDIKIFNLFYKNNVPFNYNMNSNNGWLEMFLDDKYDIQEVDRFCNFQNFLQDNKETRFYEEFSMPQTDIESRFKNYKIKNIVIESNSPTIIIRCDDYVDINYGETIKLEEINKNNNTELKLKIKIEPYLVNEQRYSIPIATFTTI